MHSCIYEGTVRHRRLSPRWHTLDYRIFMMYLDLDELEEVFRGRWLWSTRRFNLAQFRREDHTGASQLPLKKAVQELVKEKTGRIPQGPVRLLTHLRYFGYCFNPVSFYYCFEPDQEKVETIVAEVSNTPWNEQYCYVLNRSLNQANGSRFLFEFAKDFHVSPFMSMDQEYRWRFNQPGPRVVVYMENFHSQQKLFDATLSLKRREITGPALARSLVQYPFLSGKIITAIHWNALLLWLKGCPIFSHPKNQKRELQ